MSQLSTPSAAPALPQAVHPRTTERSSARPAYPPLAAAVMLLAVGLTFWRAWVCDDAYITFRAVRNLWLGHGPVFNIGERVQVFTHPLWFLVLSTGRSFWSNLHGLAVALGLLITTASFLLLARTLRPVPATAAHAPAKLPFTGRQELLLLAGAIVLLASPSYVEFQTSGLENALTHLLLFALYGHLLTSERIDRCPSAALVVLLAGLIVMNRPDQALLLGPLLVAVLAGAANPRHRRIVYLLPALAAPLAWYAFAAIYFGTPLPNPAYAKMCELGWRSGLLYATEYLRYEPLSAMTVLAAALVAPLWPLLGRWSDRRDAILWRCAALGIALQVAYVIWIGGDFMRGRFFLSSLVSAVFVSLAVASRILPQRDYGPALCISLLAAFPVVLIVRLLDYLPVGVMSGFTSLTAMERLPQACLAATAVTWIAGALVTWRLARRRPQARALCAAVLMLHAGVLLALAGYRELDWATVLSYGVLLVFALLSLWCYLMAGAGWLVLATGALSVAVSTQAQFNAYTSLTLGNGIVREYDFYRGAWYDVRFQRPDATVQPGVPRLFELGRAAAAYSRRYGPITLQHTNLGYLGYDAGPDVHLIDFHGLADAFIARSTHLPTWRPGHVWHTPPREYLECLGAVNALPDWEERLRTMDPDLRRDALALQQAAQRRSWADPAEQARFELTRRIIAGPVWSHQRLASLARFAGLTRSQ